MMPTPVTNQAPIPPPAYHRAQAHGKDALHIDALSLVHSFHSPGRWLLGPTAHPLDPLCSGSCGRGALESQAAEESLLPPSTWTAQELGKRTAIERFFGRVSLFFRLQHPPLSGWSAVTTRVALTYTASIVVGLAAQQAGRSDLIRSPKRVLAHTWEGF